MEEQVFNYLVYLGLKEPDRKKFLSALHGPDKKLDFIMTYMCGYYKITPFDLKYSGSRAGNLPTIKRFIAWIGYSYGNTQTHIAKTLNYTDHTSVYNMLRTFEIWIKSNKHLNEEYLIHATFFENIFGKFVQHYKDNPWKRS